MKTVKTENLGGGATAFVFGDLGYCTTYVYLLEKKTHFFLIDTFCGPESMAPVLDCIRNASPHKGVVVVNTHFHWDHVWGNCSFQSSPIVSHALCPKLLERHWEEQIGRNRAYLAGPVQKTLPNVTFTDRLVFAQDGIALFYTPGHTADSISVYDLEEKTLYAGDNLEKPIVYVENNDISAYLATLERYQACGAEKIRAGHTLLLDGGDLSGTAGYLQALRQGRELRFDTAYCRKVHQANRRTLQAR